MKRGLSSFYFYCSRSPLRACARRRRSNSRPRRTHRDSRRKADREEVQTRSTRYQSVHFREPTRGGSAPLQRLAARRLQARLVEGRGESPSCTCCTGSARTQPSWVSTRAHFGGLRRAVPVHHWSCPRARTAGTRTAPRGARRSNWLLRRRVDTEYLTGRLPHARVARRPRRRGPRMSI